MPVKAQSMLPALIKCVFSYINSCISSKFNLNIEFLLVSNFFFFLWNCLKIAMILDIFNPKHQHFGLNRNIFGFSFRPLFKDVVSPNSLGEEDYQTPVVYCIRKLHTCLTWVCCGTSRNMFYQMRILAFSGFKVLFKIILLIHEGILCTKS